jgi:hypothetical protein
MPSASRLKQTEREASQLWLVNAYVKDASYVFTFRRTVIVGECIYL